jgi:hypothetical protein
MPDAEEPEPGTFDALELDLDTLKIREIEELEELTGVSVDMLQEPGQPKGLVLKVMAYLSRKRTDPDFTLEQAGELVLRTAPVDDPKESSGPTSTSAESSSDTATD